MRVHGGWCSSSLTRPRVLLHRCLDVNASDEQGEGQ
jgi:hypothetical protein